MSQSTGERETSAWRDWEETTALRESVAALVKAIRRYYIVNNYCLLMYVGDALRALLPALEKLAKALPGDKHLQAEIKYARETDEYYEGLKLKRKRA